MNSNFYNNYNSFDTYKVFNYRSDKKIFNSEELITLNQAIDLIKKSIADEKEDELFYDLLITQAPSEKEKNIIKSIRDDERKHNIILRELFYEITGQTLSQDIMNAEFNYNKNYKENLEKALFGEIDAVAKYRKIMSAMPNGDSYNLLMAILTDELRHADKYNFLISTL